MNTQKDRTIEEKLDYLLKEVAELKKSQEELTNAWNTAKGIVAIIRWTATVGAGLATAWALAKGLKI